MARWVMKWRNTSTVSCLAVMIVHHAHGKLVTASISSPYRLPGGTIPYDGVPSEEVVSVDLSLTLIFSIISSLSLPLTHELWLHYAMFANLIPHS